ncbi:MAG: secretin and TonB N-terminal domain-containing protein [Syntrophales bacterium]|nr:secretin and TonB N-terminal domain-containing protein [Syntrophales bacterium]
MKQETTITPFVLFFIMGLLFLSGCAAIGGKTSAGPSPSQEQAEKAAGGAIVRDVALERIQGKERLSILLSGAADFEISRESDTMLLVTLKGVSVPDGTEKEYRGDGLRTLQRAVLYNKMTEGEKEAGVRVVLKQVVPYRYRAEGTKIIVDFDIASLSNETVPAQRPLAAGASVAVDVKTRESNTRQPEGGGQHVGEAVSLDFQDADITSVFRLMSEVSGLSIVAGPGVKAEVTVHMKNVPWDQALDTILEVNGLGRKQSGKVITVLPLAELRKAEEEQQKKDVAQGKLRQVSIEAKIVEVNTSFARELGIKWGYGYKDRWGQKDYGVMMGTSASGALTTLPNGVGLTGSNVAVNFPSTADVVAPALGLVMGTSKFILDAQLSALENTGDGKIISSPKVTTLDGVKATIKQGEEIPYKVVDDNGKASTEFKPAVLKLEVTPTITPEGRISIEVMANNDYADWSRTTNEPPIKTSSVESTVVVADGDTIVIGGIYYTTESNSKEGVPWMSDIPVIGWLFKTKTVNNAKRELLIFVTPKIVSEEG